MAFAGYVNAKVNFRPCESFRKNAFKSLVTFITFFIESLESIQFSMSGLGISFQFSCFIIYNMKREQYNYVQYVVSMQPLDAAGAYCVKR